MQLNNKNYLCVVDCHSKFSVIKRMEGLSAENLITTVKIIFAEYGIPHKLMPDAGSNFVSEKSRSFYGSINIEQALSSSYHHQSYGHVEACIKFIKHTIKMLRLQWLYTHGFTTNQDYTTSARSPKPGNIAV